MKRLQIVFLSLLLLAGCAEKGGYDYWMTHPKDLQKAVAQCEENQSGVDCGAVRRAANDFSVLVDEHNQNSAEFGKTIMALELKMNSGQPVTVDEQNKLNTMLAVIAATGMEQ